MSYVCHGLLPAVLRGDVRMSRFEEVKEQFFLECIVLIKPGLLVFYIPVFPYLSVYGC